MSKSTTKQAAKATPKTTPKATPPKVITIPAESESADYDQTLELCYGITYPIERHAKVKAVLGGSKFAELIESEMVIHATDGNENNDQLLILSHNSDIDPTIRTITVDELTSSIAVSDFAYGCVPIENNLAAKEVGPGVIAIREIYELLKKGKVPSKGMRLGWSVIAYTLDVDYSSESDPSSK